MESVKMNQKIWLVPEWEFKIYPSRDWVESTMLHWYTVKETYFVKERGEEGDYRYLIFRKAVA
jgi:hypothetical protein